MSVDPSLTSFDVLRNLLIRAFDIKSNFSISYLSTDDRGVDIYLSMLSDWDLEAAISTSCKPYLCLKVELRNTDKGLEEWDSIHKSDSINKAISKTIPGGTVFNNFFKSISKVLGIKNDDLSSPAHNSISPMSDVQFRMFQNKVGCLIHRDQFKLAVFQSGVEESLRKVVWRHLLDVYPEHLNGQERMEHLKKKSNEYYELRESWKSRMVNKSMTPDEKQVMNTVKKDVLRTDRHHSFFEGADDNHSSLMLLNILVTYAFTHPEVSYCQGMSDLASPLLVIQKDEASAYICFCSLMLRLRSNFLPDGIMMTSKFKHLSLLLDYHDPDFAERLKNHRLEADLFFCYRWILLEMKREFPLDEAAYVLEVMWSTLPTKLPGRDGILLMDPQFVSSAYLSSHSRPSLSYIILKKKFSIAGDGIQCSRNTPLGNVLESPSDETSAAMELVDVNMEEYLELERKSQEIERSLESSLHDLITSTSEQVFDEIRPSHQKSAVKIDTLKHSTLPDFLKSSANDDEKCSEKCHCENKYRPSQLSSADVKSAKSKMKLDLSVTKESNARDFKSEVDETNEESCLLDGKQKLPSSLPPPQEFGCGNPFLMFLCLSLLLQYRDRIMTHKMDYNDTAMFFDRMVRRHNARSVVAQARVLYCAYVKCQKELLESKTS